MGIHRKDPARNDFDYGAEYRAKVGSSLHIAVALVTNTASGCPWLVQLSFVSIKNIHTVEKIFLPSYKDELRLCVAVLIS